MTEQPIQTCHEDEISLLDILVTLAESWKLLVCGPIIAGILAGGLSFFWPKTFESVAVVRLTEEEVALLHSTPVLDSLIERFGLLAEAGGILDDARNGLKSRIIVAIDRKTHLVTIGAKARTPDAAQALGSGAVAAVLKQLQVKGQDKALIEKTIAINDRAISSAEDAMESIQRSLKKTGVSDQAQESAIKNLSVVNADIANRSQENEELRQKLEPKGEEVFLQNFSLPQRRVSPKLGLVVLTALLVSGFGLVLFVFIRKALRGLEQDPRSAFKIQYIKQLIGLK
jgi:capsular polysaccharide biosynthesis protein